MGFGINVDKRRDLLREVIKQGSGANIIDASVKKLKQRVGCYVCLKDPGQKFKRIVQESSTVTDRYNVCKKCYSEIEQEVVF
jgi:hypothetical protein